jgi:hypothetical protein
LVVVQVFPFSCEISKEMQVGYVNYVEIVLAIAYFCMALRKCNRELGYPCTVLAVLSTAKEPKNGGIWVLQERYEKIWG